MTNLWGSLSHVQRIKEVTEKIGDLIDKTVEDSKENANPIAFDRGNESLHREDVVNAAMTFVIHLCPYICFYGARTSKSYWKDTGMPSFVTMADAMAWTYDHSAILSP